MRVPDIFHASALDAVNKANDPSLPHEVRVAWARIAKVWQDVAQQYAAFVVASNSAGRLDERGAGSKEACTDVLDRRDVHMLT